MKASSSSASSLPKFNKSKLNAEIASQMFEMMLRFMKKRMSYDSTMYPKGNHQKKKIVSTQATILKSIDAFRLNSISDDSIVGYFDQILQHFKTLHDKCARNEVLVVPGMYDADGHRVDAFGVVCSEEESQDIIMLSDKALHSRRIIRGDGQ